MGDHGEMSEPKSTPRRRPALGPDFFREMRPLLALATAALIVAGLYWAQVVLIPIALAALDRSYHELEVRSFGARFRDGVLAQLESIEHRLPA